MNGKQAKAARGKVAEAHAAAALIALARIGMDLPELDEAREHLAAITGVGGPARTPGRGTLSRLKFDDEFRRLCIRTGVRACYTMVHSYEDGQAKVSTGGEAKLAGMVDEAMAAVHAPPAEPEAPQVVLASPEQVQRFGSTFPRPKP